MSIPGKLVDFSHQRIVVGNNPLNATDPTGRETVTSCEGVQAACRVTPQTGQTYSGGTPEENLETANEAVAQSNADLTAQDGNEWGNVFEQNADGSVTVSVSVSDGSSTSVTDGLNEIRDSTDNPVGDQHSHPGLPPGYSYQGGALSEGDVDTADILATELGAFNRTIIDGPTGRVISFDGRAGSMVQDSDGSWQRDPSAPMTGSARIILRLSPIPYVQP